MSNESLRIIKVKGSSRQRGLQHGHLLREPIERAIHFYRSFFNQFLGLTLEDVRTRASQFFEPTESLSPLLMNEFIGIAEGSGQPLEDIFALSARYEITFEGVALGECSNIFVGPLRSAEGHTLLGQNWDWRPEVMDFRVVVIAHCDDMPDHVVVTECGQPGKYGFNEYGLGFTAAGLSCSSSVSVGRNLTVAIGRRSLAQTSFARARDVIEGFPPRGTVNIMMADASGNAVDYEATPRGISHLELPPDQIYWHTNHSRLTDEPCTFMNSIIRGQRWNELTSSQVRIDRERVQSWLADTSNGPDAICKTRDDSQLGSATSLQTLCTIVMDLECRAMWVSDGPSVEAPFVKINLNHALG